MVKSGLLDQGDWKFVIAGLEPVAAWRLGLVVGGVVAYGAAMRMLGAALVRNFETCVEGWRRQIFGMIALAGAALLAAAGAAFDPRGPGTILNDALPSALGSFGLAWVGFAVHRRQASVRIDTPFSKGWIATGFVCGLLFIALLGPGLRF